MKVLKNICFGLFLVLVLAYFVIVIGPKLINGFYPFGIKTAIVLTGSMEPIIEINDFVIMKQPDEIAVDDIVAYQETEGGMEVLHRVIRIDGDEVVTKGDANNTEDKPINIKQITGVYVGKINFFGKIISFITKPIFFSIIITFCTILILLTSKRNRDKRKRDEAQNEKKRY